MVPLCKAESGDEEDEGGGETVSRRRRGGSHGEMNREKGVELETNDEATDADALHGSRRRSLYTDEYLLRPIVK